MGQKLVKQDIRTANGTLAYTRGMVIEDDAVAANDWGDYVVGRDTQAARDILAEITGDVVEEPKQTRASRSAGTSTTSTEE